MDNQSRLKLNDQKIPFPDEPQNSPGFVQKQPPEVFCKRRRSWKVCKFHTKTPMLESLFNKVTSNFIKKRLQHYSFPVKFLRSSILKNTCERLLLFVSPQNTVANSRGEFGLDETLTKWKVSIFLCMTILFDQIHNTVYSKMKLLQPSGIYIENIKFPA